MLQNQARDREIETLCRHIGVQDRRLDDLQSLSQVDGKSAASHIAHVWVELDRSNGAPRQRVEQPLGNKTWTAADLEDGHSILQAELRQGFGLPRPAQLGLGTQAFDVGMQPRRSQARITRLH